MQGELTPAGGGEDGLAFLSATFTITSPSARVLAAKREQQQTQAAERSLYIVLAARPAGQLTAARGTGRLSLGELVVATQSSPACTLLLHNSKVKAAFRVVFF